jgi:hypothetical protein
MSCKIKPRIGVPDVNAWRGEVEMNIFNGILV